MASRCADAEPRHQQALQFLRQQTAIGQVDPHTVVPRIFNEKLLVHGVAVRVKVTVRLHDHIGVGALVHDVASGVM